MKLSRAACIELGRALRNPRLHERTPDGILFPKAGLIFGGHFGSKALEPGAHPSDYAWAYGPNAVANEFINAALNSMFNQIAGPANWSIAPFLNNLAPTSALTAATFKDTQGEFTAYSEGTRQAWTPNDDSTVQSVSNDEAPATFTIATNPATPRGAVLITASGKNATTGILGAGGLFGVANTINVGGKLLVSYGMTGTST